MRTTILGDYLTGCGGAITIYFSICIRLNIYYYYIFLDMHKADYLLLQQIEVVQLSVIIG